MILFSKTEQIMERHYPWLKSPLKRLVISVSIEVVIVLLVLLIINIVFVIVYKENLNSLYEKIKEGIIWASLMSLGGILFANGIFFFKSWRQSAINEEILKREKLVLEYEALKNQVNPHFLFNSLTALTTLVHEDPDKAVSFIKKFSEVYRYVLDTGNQEVVSLSDEMKVLEDMAFLYRYRHGDSLQIIIELASAGNKYIVPMALQMLLENALKHNVISGEKPLKVVIQEINGYISVKNNLQPKPQIRHSGKLGLNNIRRRYSYLSDKPVMINKDASTFEVKIPILAQS